MRPARTKDSEVECFGMYYILNKINSVLGRDVVVAMRCVVDYFDDSHLTN